MTRVSLVQYCWFRLVWYSSSSEDRWRKYNLPNVYYMHRWLFTCWILLSFSFHLMSVDMNMCSPKAFSCAKRATKTWHLTPWHSWFNITATALSPRVCSCLPGHPTPSLNLSPQLRKSLTDSHSDTKQTKACGLTWAGTQIQPSKWADMTSLSQTISGDVPETVKE